MTTNPHRHGFTMTHIDHLALKNFSEVHMCRKLAQERRLACTERQINVLRYVIVKNLSNSSSTKDYLTNGIMKCPETFLLSLAALNMAFRESPGIILLIILPFFY